MNRARLLVAGEDRTDRTRHGVMLTRAGHAVDTASTPDEALQKVAAGEYDLVLATFDGPHNLELLSRIKRACSSLPVVLGGAEPSAEQVIQAFRGGAYDFLTLPLEPEALQQQAQRALAVRRLGAKRREVLRMLEAGRLNQALAAHGRETLRDAERRHIVEALSVTGGNKKQAAEMLGIHRGTLYAKLRRHGLIELVDDEAGQASASSDASAVESSR